MDTLTCRRVNWNTLNRCVVFLWLGGFAVSKEMCYSNTPSYMDYDGEHHNIDYSWLKTLFCNTFFTHVNGATNWHGHCPISVIRNQPIHYLRIFKHAMLILPGLCLGACTCNNLVSCESICHTPVWHYISLDNRIVNQKYLPIWIVTVVTHSRTITHCDMGFRQGKKYWVDHSITEMAC